VITAALGKLYGLPVVEIDEVEVDLDALANVPESVAWHNHLLPIRIENGVLVVAVSDPRHVGALDTVRLLSGMKVECVLAEPNALLRTIVTHYRAFSRRAAQNNSELLVKNRLPESKRFPGRPQPSRRSLKLWVNAVRKRPQATQAGGLKS